MRCISEMARLVHVTASSLLAAAICSTWVPSDADSNAESEELRPIGSAVKTHDIRYRGW